MADPKPDHSNHDKLSPDRATMPVPCPHCGHATLKEVGWLKSHDSLTCETCGRTVPVDQDRLFAPQKELRDDMDRTQDDLHDAIVDNSQKKG